MTQTSFAEPAVGRPAPSARLEELPPRERLAALEQYALRHGMPEQQLRVIRLIGDCDQQVLLRIDEVRAWLVKHGA